MRLVSSICASVASARGGFSVPAIILHIGDFQPVGVEIDRIWIISGSWNRFCDA